MSHQTTLMEAITKKKKKIETKEGKVESAVTNEKAEKDDKKRKESAVTAMAPKKGGKWDALPDQITDPDWQKALAPEFKKDYFRGIITFLNKEGGDKEIFPPFDDVFSAFNLTPMNQIKVVILGQDPYHDNGQAHGLCFSVRKGIKTPPSLVNIYKELEQEIPNFKNPGHGFLEEWAKRGVFLLNASLTVQAHKANSHAGCGWQTFTDKVIETISAKCNKVVFILWGGFAQKKTKLIDAKKHHIIKAAHPSPLSVTKFKGSKCFIQTNDWLKKNGRGEIDWTLSK